MAKKKSKAIAIDNVTTCLVGCYFHFRPSDSMFFYDVSITARSSEIIYIYRFYYFVLDWTLSLIRYLFATLWKDTLRIRCQSFLSIPEEIRHDKLH